MTHVHLDRPLLNTPNHVAQLSAFPDSISDHHPPRMIAPLMLGKRPYLVSVVVNMDDATFTTLFFISIGASVTSRFTYCALLDTGLPQSFIYQGAFNQMVLTGVADASYVRALGHKS